MFNVLHSCEVTRLLSGFKARSEAAEAIVYMMRPDVARSSSARQMQVVFMHFVPFMLWATQVESVVAAQDCFYHGLWKSEKSQKLTASYLDI